LTSISASSPIEDYAIVGDCRSAALISKRGSIDWLCLPTFDSPSIFGALLDSVRGGRFSVCPSDPFRATRRYVGTTNVLETTFTTDSGVLRVTDLMPVTDESTKRRELLPDHEILRKVECEQGSVEVDVVFDPRPDYARVTPRIRESSSMGYFYEYRTHVAALKTDLPLHISPELPALTGRHTLQAGEARYLSMTFAHGYPAVTVELGRAAGIRIARSLEWWDSWAQRCQYRGAYREHVIRSALTLKLLTYAPSGAMVAAPTTSLPEKIGGVRNWDYRFCWLRDASLTLRALLDLGFKIEGEAFLSWLLHATRLTWPDLQILYDVYGESRVPEQELSHLEGYAGSRPVRIGNDAANQLQLDTYGEVIDAAFQWVVRGGAIDRTTARMLIGLGKTVCRRWPEPDEGIWEPRGGRRDHTHSKAMCWVALDRLIKLHEKRHVQAPIELFEVERKAIREQIERRGYNSALQSYVSAFDGEQLDASLLLLGINGYADPAGIRMKNTHDRIREKLGVNGLLYRYLGDDGLPPGEGAFGICGFWAVEYLARRGDFDAARKSFESLLSHSNDLLLFAEETDPETGTALGNFPQAFTHVGLINAALALAEAQ
jgi:GH15 family glucan-1,4-alpha-glucosidase